jgi:hypothetical protein
MTDAIQTANAELDDDQSAVEMARNEPSNHDDTVSVRFMGDHDGGTSFKLCEGGLFKDWYNPDKIVAEDLGVTEAINNALDVLEAEADLRSVPEARVGSIHFDRETGAFSHIKIYGMDAPEGVEQRMATQFDI